MRRVTSTILTLTLLMWCPDAMGNDCVKGKPCGSTCIPMSHTCHSGGYSGGYTWTGDSGGTSKDTDDAVIVVVLVSAVVTGLLVWLFNSDVLDQPTYKQSTLKDDLSAAYGTCSGSDGCLRNGLCTNTGKCVAGSDEDCRQSVSCRLAGRCVAQNGVCVLK